MTKSHGTGANTPLPVHSATWLNIPTQRPIDMSLRNPFFMWVELRGRCSNKIRLTDFDRVHSKIRQNA